MFGGAESRRAGIYRNLAALEGSGIPLRTAVDKVRDPAIEPVARALDEGLPPEEAWAQAPAFGPLERALVKAGAKSGQLADAFLSLEQIFESRAKARRDLAVGFAYPVFLLHLAAIVPNLKTLILDGLFPYLKVAFLPLVILWAAVVGSIFLYAFLGKTAPALVDAIIGGLPVVGAISRKRALGHAIQAFLALYRAGVPVRMAVEGARDASTFVPVASAFDRIAQRLDAGATIGDAWLNENALPEEVREAASTGSLTGKLEDTLGGARRRLEHEADSLQKGLIAFLPVIAYLAVALMIGWVVVSFFLGYVNAFNEAMK